MKRLVKMKTHAQVKAELMKNSEFKKAYDDLGPEFALIRAIIEQRAKKGLTQKELARRAGTKQSAIARFEAGGSNPTLDFMRRLSRALGVTLSVKIRS